MTDTLLPSPIQQFFDSNSAELSGGKLFTYAAGTSTKLAVYTDNTGNTAFPNPIILNSRGEPAASGTGPSLGIWMAAGTAYKFILSPSTDTDPPTNPIWTLDNISVGSSVGGISTVTDTGSVNAMAVALSPAPVSYTTGLSFFVIPANNSTGAVTINANSLGAKNLLFNGNALTNGALISGHIYLVNYDGTQFELLTVPGSSNWVVNGMLATMAAGTVKANTTNASATPSDVLVPTLITAGVYGADGGSVANTYTVTPTVPPTSLAAGYLVAVKIAHTNTGASTLNVNAIGATAIQYQGAALAAGLLVAGQIAIFMYDGTVFELVNPGSGAGGSGGSTTIGSIATIGNTVGTIAAQGWFAIGGNIRNWAVMNLQDFGNGNYSSSGTWTYTKAFPNSNILGYGCQNVAVLANQTSGGYPARGTGMPITVSASSSAWCAQNTNQLNTVAAYYLWVDGN